MKFFERRFWETENLRVAGFVLAGSGFDSGVAVERFLHQAGRFLPYDAAVVWGLVDHKLEWLGSNGIACSDLVPLNRVEGLFKPLVEERRPQLLTDFAETHPDRFLSPGVSFKSWLGLPLVCQNEVVGIAEFWSHSAGQLRLDHLAAVSTLADPAATALHNARRFRTAENEARLDPLTGLLTRRSFERSAELLRRTTQAPFLALLLLDLDHFKQVNDLWGHKAGDRALQAVSDVCRRMVREGDLVCRWGGEEILLLLTGSGTSEARKAAVRLRLEVRRIRFEEFPQLTLTASIGVAAFAPSDQGKLGEWLEKADKALYDAKNAGRDRVKTWAPSRARRILP